MKVYPDKLNAQLAKGLAPIYTVSGEDPLLTGEAADAIRAVAREQGYDERESHVVTNAAQFDWQKPFAGLDNLSLFASRRIFELRLPSGRPGREGGAALTELAGDPPPDTLCIIHLGKIDGSIRKAKWLKSLDKAGVWVDCLPLKAEQLPAWLASRARSAGLQLDTEAAQVLAARTEGNLLAAQQELDKLTLLSPGQNISAAQILDSVADGARYDTFKLADAALGQDAQRAVRMLYGLRRDGTAPPQVSWALARESSALINVWAEIQAGTPVGRAMQLAGVWQQKQPLFRKALQSHNEASVRRLARQVALTDRIVKGAHYGAPWNALLELVLLMARPQFMGLVGSRG